MPSDRDVLNGVVESDPAAWMEKNFWIEDPRCPETGELFEPGPIRLIDAQRKILRYGLTKVDGLFPWITLVYSTIKKSGKTRIAAGVAAWFAATQGAYNEVYCLANDGKQSKDRILSAIKKAVTLNPDIGWKVTQTKITLPNGTFIESIPCDPSGQAGSNPGLTVFSEMWGYRHRHQERLWTEMTIPPTRWGKALRWVESYAGFAGESNVLENLYTLGKENGKRHPAFDEIPVYYNTEARLYCYWDEGVAARRLPWQTDDYYSAERQLLRPDEFKRIHLNQWVNPLTKAFELEWWDACQQELPPLDARTPVVMALDASVSHDSCALVLVSRNPRIRQNDPERDKQVAIRKVRVWSPPPGGKIDLTNTLEAGVRWAVKNYNVVMCVYDEYQLHKMATDLKKEGIVVMRVFSQGKDRAVADNQFYQMVLHKRVAHDGGNVLRTHVDNAAIKQTGDSQKIRFVKMETGESFGRTERPIDALVAASMASYKCLKLVL